MSQGVCTIEHMFDPVEPEPSEPVLSEPVLSEPVLSEPVLSEPVLSEPVLSEPVLSGFGVGCELGVVVGRGVGALVALAGLCAGTGGAAAAGSAAGSGFGAGFGGCGVGVVSDGVLVEVSDALEVAQRALDSARLAVVGELDARNVSLRTAGLVTHAWLGHNYLLPRPVSSQIVSTARKLRCVLPLVAQALTQGTITSHHAFLLARLTTPRVEPIVVMLQTEFIDLAAGIRFEQWANEIRALIDLADPDGAHIPNADRNRISMSDGLSGELHLDCDFVADTAATIRAALLQETQRRLTHHRKLHTHNPDHPLPQRSQLLAEAFTELIRRGITTQPGTTNNPVTDITLIIEASDPLTAHTPDGIRLQDGTTRLLNCDPKIQALIINTLGVPLDLGTTIRYANNNQRKAINIRDHGCVFPGCDAPHNWVDLHHIHKAQHGGPTNLNNLISLCKQHHATIHTNGWSIKQQPDTPGRYTITTPTGTQLNTQHNTRKPNP